MLGLKLNHVSKRGHCLATSHYLNQACYHCPISTMWFHTGKTTSLYWIRAHSPILHPQMSSFPFLPSPWSVSYAYCSDNHLLISPSPATSPRWEGVGLPCYVDYPGRFVQEEHRHCYPLLDAGLILGLHPANERLRYFIMTSLIGWAYT